jgi:hypothetical protein
MDFILDKISRDEVLKMLKYEQKLRYLSNIQELYIKGYNENIPELKNGKYIDDIIQMTILKYFGYNRTDKNLNEYRKIFIKYKNDRDIINSIYFFSLYLKNQNNQNIDNNSSINVGSININIKKM